jgi:N4-gp56 family major capsid protein
VTSQFADTKTELGKNKGDTIKFTRYDDLRGAARLSEVEPIQTTNLSAYSVSIQVDEYGFGVEESEKLLLLGWDDVMARATKLLGEHYGRTTDAMVQDEFIAAASLQSFLPNSRANRSALIAGDNMSVALVKDVVELMSVNKTPKINGAYVALVHPHVSRKLRDDSTWIDSHKYTNPAVDNIFMGEIGMLEGVRFIETTFLPIIKVTSGAVHRDGFATGAVEAVTNATYDTYQSLFLGANAVGWAQALPVEMRDAPIADFGRSRKLAWYSIFGFGSIRPENVCLAETI